MMMMRKTHGGALRVVALAALGAAACSSSHNKGDGGAGNGGAGGAGTAGACSDAGTLYSRLGGDTGIHALVEAMTAAELADEEIKSYFFNQLATPVPAGHCTIAEMNACFTNYISIVSQGLQADNPPSVVVDAGGTTFSYMCKFFHVVHPPLLITGGTYDRYVMIASAALANANVSACDIAALFGIISTQRQDIVSPSLKDAGAQPYPGDAGADASGQ
jgi:hypothetical protein